MEIAEILQLNNDNFRKNISKDSKGYLFDSQINTAKDIVKSLTNKVLRRNHVILVAKMQSGKTGVCNAVTNIINTTDIKKEMGVNKFLFITGMNDCGLKRQTTKRVLEQVINATKDNTYISKRSNKNLDKNVFYVMKNSDLSSFDEPLDNSVIFVDEAHYGSNRNNVLTKFFTNNGFDWKDSSELTKRNIYIVSISATPFDEVVSDTKECKKIIYLKPTSEYIGVSEYIANGTVFDASGDEIETDGEIFDIIYDNYQRMKMDEVSGVIIIRTRKFNLFEENDFINDNFDLMELSSNGSNIEYDKFSEAIDNLVKKNEFNKKLKDLSVKNVSVEPFKIKPLLVLIKGAFRAGITLNEKFKDYIYMIYDYSAKAETTAQALLGRMCGYRDSDDKLTNTHFYLNKQFAEMYSDWENNFQDRTKVPCNKTEWVWLDNNYQGSDAVFGSRPCGNIAIDLNDNDLQNIVNSASHTKNRVELAKRIMPTILQKYGIKIDYDYVGEVLFSGKNNYKSTSQKRRFDAFTKDSLVFQFRPYKIKDFVKDTGRNYLLKEDLGKKAIFCVLDANVYSNCTITGNKRLLIYHVEVGLKKKVPNLHSMYKEHKDTSLAN